GPTPPPESERIRLPQGLLRRDAELAARHVDLAEGQPQRLLIVAKDRRKNCVVGQRYPPSFGNQFLASGSWLHASRSVGDYFTILAQGRSNSFHQVNRESPVTSFTQLGLRPEVAAAASAAVGSDRPTLIQCLAAGPLLSSWNTACLAETGNGKTLAYLAPLLSNLLSLPEGVDRSRRCILVVCPTLVLMRQIAAAAGLFCSQLGLRVATADEAKREAELGVIVGVPERINDLLRCRADAGAPLLPTACVLDEADCLLDDSFVDGTSALLGRLFLQTGEPQHGVPMGAQVVLASATMPPSLEEALGSGLLPSDSFARVATPFAHRPPAQSAQLFVRASRDTKRALCLARIRRNLKRQLPTIVFCNASATTKELADALGSSDAVALHSGLRAAQRDDLVKAFSFGHLPVLIATDLASRGLDTLAARQIINCDLPGFPAIYLHRLGRIGRVGSGGSPFSVAYAAERFEVRTVQ
uniref:RNA helicase n=1 Tax=Macrostomum lignano TaxID=282301 RepID=A0A1I8J8N5_9PLAT